jgi:hypothetical protein
MSYLTDPHSAYYKLGKEYPFQQSLIKWGLIIGIAIGGLLFSPILGIAILTVCVLSGLVWQQGIIPSLPFCITYQWLFIIAGYVFMHIFGYYPGTSQIGKLNAAIVLSLFGLTAVVLGIRFIFQKVPLTYSAHSPRTIAFANYDQKKLIILIVCLFSINWIFGLVDQNLLGAQFRQIFVNFMNLRFIFLFLLVLNVFNNRRGYVLLLGVASFVFLPQLLTGFSDFKELLFILLIALAGQLGQSGFNKKVNTRVILLISLISFIFLFLIGFGLLWSGGVKAEWRQFVWYSGAQSSVFEKLEVFWFILMRNIENFSFQSSLEELLARFSSGLSFFSLVLERVPSIIPHENGELVGRAIQHILTPRFLFPDKGSLGGDSWLVNTYAGLAVAGDEQGASIGLGYIAEFYIDFGVPMMFLGLFIYGCVIGIIHRTLYRISPSLQIADSFALFIFLQHFSGYESAFAKALGGLVQSSLISFVLISLLGGVVHKNLLAQSRLP